MRRPRQTSSICAQHAALFVDLVDGQLDGVAHGDLGGLAMVPDSEFSDPTLIFEPEVSTQDSDPAAPVDSSVALPQPASRSAAVAERCLPPGPAFSVGTHRTGHRQPFVEVGSGAQPVGAKADNRAFRVSEICVVQ